MSGEVGDEVSGQQTLASLRSLYTDCVLTPGFEPFASAQSLSLSFNFADIMYNGEMNEKIKLLYRLHIPPGKKF